MVNALIDRRAFLGGTVTTLATIPAAAGADQQTGEAGVYGFELPPKSTLWGVVTFLGEQMVEVTIRSKDRSTSERGRRLHRVRRLTLSRQVPSPSGAMISFITRS
jgi:hypothetical protein